MSYKYPLGAKVLSEFVGTALTILFGESIIANELLPSTKGHGMGYLAVAIGFGLAFGVNIAWFRCVRCTSVLMSRISMCSPGVCL